MDSSTLQPKLSPRFLVYLRNYLLDRDANPAPLFRQCGVDEVTDAEYALPLATDKLLELLDLAAHHCEDSLLGFHMATHFHYEASALIVLTMLAAPTVESALRTLSHFDQYVDTGITTRCDFGDKQSMFSADLLGVGNRDTKHLNEYLLSFTAHSLNTATRKRMPLQKVHFQHQRQAAHDHAAIAVLEEFFNCDVSFGHDSNRLFFASGYLREELHSRNELLFTVLRNALNTYFYSDSAEAGIVNAVCRQLMHSFDSSRQGLDSSLQSIAKALSMSERTLRRRLHNEGVSFQEAKNMARERQAKYYLTNTSMNSSEIALRLGFSELSAFSRAFKRWTGSTPQEYRSTVRKLLTA